MTTMMIMILRLATYGTLSTGGVYFLFSGHLGRVSLVLQGFYLAYFFCVFCCVAGRVIVAVLGWLTLGEMNPVKSMGL